MIRAADRKDWLQGRQIVLLLLLSGGCSEDDVLDGTWRQPLDSVGSENGQGYELVLGQYGEDVAGLLREYDSRGPEGDPWTLYGTERYCRPLEHGSFRDGMFTFEVRYDDGTPWRYALNLSEDGEELSGVFLRDDGESSLQRFERIGTATRRECDWINELVVQGMFGDAPPGERNLRATLVFLGTDGRVPCMIEAGESAELTMNPLGFDLAINRKPPSCSLLHRPDKVTLSWGLFVVFDDLDGDRFWDRNPLFPEAEEPLVGLCSDRVMIYLDGDLAQELEDAGSEHPLQDFTAQGYTLVQVELDEGGNVRAVERAPKLTVSIEAVGSAQTPHLSVP